MNLRAVVVGQIEPMPGGAARSVSPLLPRLAEAGIEICALGPATPEDLMTHGDRYAARNPQLRVLRFLVPAHHVEPYRPRPPAHAESEDRQVRAMILELARSFRPHLLIAAHECYARIVGSLARETGLPFCIWLRGSPTAQILRGASPEDRTREFIEVYRSADSAHRGSAAISRRASPTRFAVEGVRTVPNALDLDRFAPRPAAASGCAGYYGLAAR